MRPAAGTVRAMPFIPPPPTVAEHYRSGFEFHFRCDNCGRYRRVEITEIARLVGWDYDVGRLLRAASCAKCRARGGLVTHSNGRPSWFWQPMADEVIAAHPQFHNVVPLRPRV